MSIYSTLWSIQVEDPAAPFSQPQWVEVTAQAVPAHIGSPSPGSGYGDGDPYSAFLPPAMEADADGHGPHHRAVVFITSTTEKGTARNPQEYRNPLFVLTGQEYAAVTFAALHALLQDAVATGPRVMAEWMDRSGRVHVLTQDDLNDDDRDQSGPPHGG